MHDVPLCISVESFLVSLTGNHCILVGLSSRSASCLTGASVHLHVVVLAARVGHEVMASYLGQANNFKLFGVILVHKSDWNAHHPIIVIRYVGCLVDIYCIVVVKGLILFLAVHFVEINFLMALLVVYVCVPPHPFNANEFVPFAVNATSGGVQWIVIWHTESPIWGV